MDPLDLLAQFFLQLIFKSLVHHIKSYLTALRQKNANGVTWQLKVDIKI